MDEITIYTFPWRPLGSGGFGDVFLATAEDSSGTFEVAVKVLRGNTGKQRFEREIEVMKAMSTIFNGSQCIPIIKSGYTSEDLMYYAMPYYTNGSLSDILRGGRSFKAVDALKFMSKIVCRLELYHDRNIIHNDLKPDNIFITKKFVPLIGDWGLAYVPDQMNITQEGVGIGTPGWTHPSIIEGTDTELRQSPIADIYSLGLILMKMSRENDIVMHVVQTMLDGSLDSCATVLGLLEEAINILEERKEWHDMKIERLRQDAKEAREKSKERNLLGILGAMLFGGAVFL